MEKKRPRIFYGWVLAVLAMLMVCCAGLLSTGLTTNLNAMREWYGFSGSETSLVLTIRSIVSFLVVLPSSWLFKKFGLKKVVVTALFFGALAFFLFCVGGKNIYMYYIGGACAGLTYTYAFTMSASILMRRWFRERIGTAIAISSSGTALVSIVFAPAVQAFIDRFGVKAGFLFQGGYVLLVMILCLLLIRETPEEMGLRMYGGDPRDGDSDEPAGKGEKKLPGNPPASAGKENLKKGLPAAALFLFVIATFLDGFSASPASAHFILNFTSEGIGSDDAAAAMAIYGIVQLVFRLLYGRLSDRFGVKKVALSYMLIFASGCFLMFMVPKVPTVGFMYLTFMILAIGIPYQTQCYAGWMAEWESENYRRSLSKCQIGYQLGALTASSLPGIIADFTGHYSYAYLMFFIIILLTAAVMLIAYRIAGKEKGKDRK